MANIKKLQLNGEDIIPITHESAVIDDNGISIADKYQTKEDQNLDTDSKTIIGAINELNVNNVHLGNALGAVEYDDNDNPIIERLDDLESSIIKLIGNSSNNESAKEEALKNLLANILREEGIEITEGDTLTDLITKVDNGFDSKNAEIEELENLILEDSSSGGLDIISATELPATGNENQICVITQNPTDKFILSYSGFSDFADVDNSTICGDMSLAPSYASVLINTGSVSQRYNFLKFIQDSNLKLSYIYQNNNWNEFTIERSYLINNKVHVTDSEFGGFYNLNSVSSYITFNNYGLDFNVTTQYGKVRLCTANKVDFSLFNNMVITRSSSTSSHTTYIYRTDTQLTSAAYFLYDPIEPYITISKQTPYQSEVGYTFETTVYDISDWDGVHYLSVDVYSNSGGSVDTMISDLYFY